MFLSEDPLGFALGRNIFHDGLSLYRGYFALIGIDPLGLWKIKRLPNKRTAIATAEKGDTYQSLAEKIGLRYSEFDKWASGQNADGVVCPGDEIVIPNTVLMAWYGHLGELGKDLVGWRSFFKRRIQRQGFYIIDEDGHDLVDFDNETSTKQKLESHIPNRFAELTASKELTGFVFYGHGNEHRISLRKRIKVGERFFGPSYSSMASALNYKLSHVEVRACDSQNSIMLFSGEPNGYHYFSNGCDHYPIINDFGNPDYFDDDPWWESATSEEWWDVFYGVEKW